MDIFSLAVGFVVGALTGAAGSYLGDKYTDSRRAKEKKSQSDNEWKDLHQKFPLIMDEMIEDVCKPESRGIRKFFVCESTWSISKSEACFEYHTDIYCDLNAAILYLEDLGYIENITQGNTPMYRFREHFIERLKNA